MPPLAWQKLRFARTSGSRGRPRARPPRAPIIAFIAPVASAQALPDDTDLKLFAVHINRTPPQSWPGYGVYLSNGLILTAEHVPGHFARTKPHVLIAGQDLPAALVKEGSFENVDLTLLSIDSTNLPVHLQMRRMPLCATPPVSGETIVVATPEGTARSHVLPQVMVPLDLRGRFDTLIGELGCGGAKARTSPALLASLTAEGRPRRSSRQSRARRKASFKRRRYRRRRH
jgi:hypothetical protein